MTDDLTRGLEDKAAGQAQALNAAAAAEWRENAWRAIVRLAASGQPFTSEAVVAAIGLPSGTVASNRNNAVGAIMNAAARAGFIRKTGRRVLAHRRPSHARELAEWEGLL